MTSNFYFGKNHLITKISSKEATETVHILHVGICERKKYSESSNKSDIF